MTGVGDVFAWPYVVIGALFGQVNFLRTPEGANATSKSRRRTPYTEPFRANILLDRTAYPDVAGGGRGSRGGLMHSCPSW